MILRVKLNLLFITLLVVTNGSLVYLLHEKQKAFFLTNLETQANTIHALISQDSINLIALNKSNTLNSDSTTSITAKLSAFKALSNVNFYNTDHKTILSISNKESLQSGDVIHRTFPLISQGTEIGKIKFFFTTKALEEANERLIIFLIPIFIVGLLLTLFFTLYLDRFFSRRVSMLNAALYTTSEQQDYTIRLPNNNKDELGKAYANFNHLVTNIENLLSKQAKQEQLLNFQANHDNLTGLHNRLYITNLLKNLILISAKETHALCYFDLDKFKIINDTFGHPVGDQLLIKLAEQIEGFVNRLTDANVARIGGDEFVLIIRNTDEPSLSKILQNLKTLIQDFRLNYQTQELSIEVSIGAILFTPPHENIHTLFSAADTACYHAKHKGGNTISIFWLDSPELKREKELINWVIRIRKALTDHQLIVYLQPIIKSQNILLANPSYESLIRLREGDKIISPFAFIPTLERFQMMPEIDFYMVNEVVKHLKTRPEFLNEVEHISINLSGTTLTVANAAQKVIKIIEQAKLPFHKFCFEITETSAVSNLTEAKTFIKELSEKGCLFSLDDFGTGMSSFEYLYALPLNTLKIDGSFIKDIIHDPVKFEMVKAMQNIAILMNLETVAEYVENQEIINKLNEIGIHHHQGYHYSEPKPIQEFMNPDSKSL